MMRFPLVILAATLALNGAAFSEQVLERGGFEWPPITARKAKSEGGDITKSAMNAEWITFKDKSSEAGGKVIFGLTNEISRSGRQSMFVKFEKVSAKNVSTVLSSDLIPIQPKQAYRAGIWGRVDKKEPLALDTRLPLLRLRVDFFKNGIDEETKEPSIEQVGEPEFRTQMLPGSKRRPPLFTSTQWNQFWANMESPEEATFAKITWTWETTGEEGETNGLMFFDDVTLEGAAGVKEDPFEDDPEVQAERKATADDPNLVKPDEDKKPAMNVTPLNKLNNPPPNEPAPAEDKSKPAEEKPKTEPTPKK